MSIREFGDRCSLLPMRVPDADAGSSDEAVIGKLYT